MQVRRDHGRRRLGVVALVAVALGLVVQPVGTSAVAEAGPGPVLPGLLPVPDPLPPGDPGDVIASAPFPAGDFGFAVEAYQVLYLSTGAAGTPEAVSGVVLVPTGTPEPPGGRSVVAWAHGTTGLADGCAPSLHNQQGGRLNSPHSYDRIDDLLAEGHIVTATDYPGLGTPGVHPYLHGLSEGGSVLDSIRAARAFGGNDTAVIQGFSQGSQAAVFAGAEWPTYAPELSVRAVVPIGTPSRFGEAFAALDLPVVQSYINLVLAGLIAGQPHLDRRQILTPAGELAYDTFANIADASPYCVNPSFQFPSDLAANPMTVPEWQAALEANLPGRRLVPAPVLMVQSESDEQALAFLADGVCRDLVASGTDVRMWRYDNESHVDTVSVSATDRMRWIDDRLDGVPLTDSVAFAGEVPRVLTECPAEDAPPLDPAEPGPDPSNADASPTAVVPASTNPVSPAFAG
jgi:hypothetical protein